MARDLIFKTLEAGYIQHGHLYGHRAFIIEIASRDDDLKDTLVMSMTDVARMIVQAKVNRVIMHAGPETIAETRDLSEYLGNALPRVDRVYAVTPGAALTWHDVQTYDTVLVLRRGDLYLPSELPQYIGSVSVQNWIGIDDLERVQEITQATQGYYIVLPREDLGNAKIWLSATGGGVWQLIPQYDLDADEPAETEYRFTGNT